MKKNFDIIFKVLRKEIKNMDILKLNPIFKDYIWGGTRLRDDFGYESDLNPMAEGWVLACHKDGKNTVCNKEYCGKTLEEIINENGVEKHWQEIRKKYFPGEVFFSYPQNIEKKKSLPSS